KTKTRRRFILEVQFESDDSPCLVSFFLNRMTGIADINAIRLVGEIQYVDENSQMLIDPLASGEIGFDAMFQTIVARGVASDCENIPALVIDRNSRQETFLLVCERSITHIRCLPGQDE